MKCLCLKGCCKVKMKDLFEFTTLGDRLRAYFTWSFINICCFGRCWRDKPANSCSMYLLSPDNNSLKPAFCLYHGKNQQYGKKGVFQFFKVWSGQIEWAIKRNDIYNVGMAGFEPTTSSTPCWRDTRLRYIPIYLGCKSKHFTLKTSISTFKVKKLLKNSWKLSNGKMFPYFCIRFTSMHIIPC